MDKLINALNDLTVAFCRTRGVEAHAFGIAEPVLVDNVGGSEQVRPGIVGVDGEVNSDLFDDRYAVGFYHRLNGKEYGVVPDSGYGDARHVTEVVNLSMIVYGLRSEMSAIALQEQIAHSINNLAYKQSATRAYGTVKNVLFDRRQVFSGEYQGIRFFIRPNVFLFKINYTITLVRREACE